mgnify:CR=1 FL=1
MINNKKGPPLEIKLSRRSLLLLLDILYFSVITENSPIPACLFIIYDTGCDQTDLVTFRYREMYDLLDRVSLDIGEFAFGHLLSLIYN